MIGIVLSACGGSASGVVGSPSTTPVASGSPAAPVPAGAVRFVATPFKSLATVKVQEHLAVNLINTDAVLTSTGVDGVLTLNADGSFTADS